MVISGVHNNRYIVQSYTKDGTSNTATTFFREDLWRVGGRENKETVNNVSYNINCIIYNITISIYLYYNIRTYMDGEAIKRVKTAITMIIII